MDLTVVFIVLVALGLIALVALCCAVYLTSPAPRGSHEPRLDDLMGPWSDYETESYRRED